jgi:D-cysteine desulfhydrase
VSEPLWPIFERFPKLAGLPRIQLRSARTPIEQASDRLWIKRDDLTALPIGGNKARSLELLLGGVEAGDTIITGGSLGSTHALTTVVHAKRLNARVIVGTWRQEINDVADEVSRRLDAETERVKLGNPVAVALWMAWRRLRRDHVIPAGGTSPLGIIGHVNAAFELAKQIEGGALPVPDRVVVPLGTGGTAAGIALGLALAGVRTRVVGARVVPRIIGRAGRVRRLMMATAGLIERVTGEPVRASVDIDVDQTVYGGAYARPLPGSPATTTTGTRLDPTYSAKAWVAAMASARQGTTLFWMTFDSRWMKP